MRLLFVANTTSDPNQGAVGCDLGTMAALRRLGHEVDAVWGPDMPHLIRHPNLFQLLELPRRYAAAVAARCRATPYDVIQVNQPHAWLAAREHRRSGRPGVFVNRSHGWEPVLEEVRRGCATAQSDPRPAWRQVCSEALQPFLLRHNELALAWSDGVVLSSQDEVDWLLKRHPEAADRLLALAPGIAESYHGDVAAMTPERSRSLLYVGRFAAIKGPDTAAAVFRGIMERNADVRATWVCGKESHPQVRALLGGAASARVALLDWVSREDLRRVYDSHGVFVITTRFEGFSLAFLEGMARGLCVLGTRIDGMRQAIRDGENGFLFEPGDAAAMIEAGVRLTARPDLCAAVSAQARRTALGYTWDRTAKELTAFHARLIERKSARNR